MVARVFLVLISASIALAATLSGDLLECRTVYWGRPLGVQIEHGMKLLKPGIRNWTLILPMPKGVKIFLLAHNTTTSGEEIRFTRLRSRPGLGSSNLKFPESLCDQTNGVGVTVCDVAPAKIKIIDQHHAKVSRTGDLSQAAEFTVTEFCYNGILYKV